MRGLNLETKILSDELSTFLTDKKSRRIRVGTEVVLVKFYEQLAASYAKVKLTGQILRSTHFKFSVPKTFRRLSTTPPCSRGFIAQVPMVGDIISQR